MTVWILNPFDNLPLEGYRPQRYWLLSQAFAAAGHHVVYWTSDFSHANKRKRDVSSRQGGTGDVASAFELKLVPTPPYAKNVSLARIRSHRQLAENWLACAQQETRKPDFIIASLPPLRLPLLAKRYADSVGAKFIVDIMDDWPGTFYRLLPRGLRWMGPVLFSGSRRTARYLYAHADLVTGCADRYGDLARSAGAHAFYRAYHGIALTPSPSQSNNQTPPIFSSPSLSNQTIKHSNKSNNQIPPDSSSPSPSQSNNQKIQQSKNLKILYLGNLGRTYDLPTLLAAVEQLPDVTLDVAGSGAQESLLKDCRSPRVRFHGYCGAEKLEALLAQADVGIVPMAPESCVGVPYKFADYARAGLAIASSLGGESGDLFTRYGAGEAYVAHDVDSLVAALTKLRARLAEAKAGARHLAETEFDAHRIYADYVAEAARQLKMKNEK